MEPIYRAEIVKFKGDERRIVSDILVREIKLEILLNGKRFGALMATPSDQKALAIGYLLSENLISDPSRIKSIEIAPDGLSVNVRRDKRKATK